MNKSLDSENQRNLNTTMFFRINIACTIFSVQKKILIQITSPGVNTTLLELSLKKRKKS